MNTAKGAGLVVLVYGAAGLAAVYGNTDGLPWLVVGLALVAVIALMLWRGCRNPKRMEGKGDGN